MTKPLEPKHYWLNPIFLLNKMRFRSPCLAYFGWLNPHRYQNSTSIRTLIAGYYLPIFPQYSLHYSPNVSGSCTILHPKGVLSHYSNPPKNAKLETWNANIIEPSWCHTILSASFWEPTILIMGYHGISWDIPMEVSFRSPHPSVQSQHWTRCSPPRRRCGGVTIGVDASWRPLRRWFQGRWLWKWGIFFWKMGNLTLKIWVQIIKDQFEEGKSRSIRGFRKTLFSDKPIFIKKNKDWTNQKMLV